jgi:hypothetical protein
MPELIAKLHPPPPPPQHGIGSYLVRVANLMHEAYAKCMSLPCIFITFGRILVYLYAHTCVGPKITIG